MLRYIKSNVTNHYANKAKFRAKIFQLYHYTHIRMPIPKLPHYM